MRRFARHAPGGVIDHAFNNNVDLSRFDWPVTELSEIELQNRTVTHEMLHAFLGGHQGTITKPGDFGIMDRQKLITQKSVPLLNDEQLALLWRKVRPKLP